MGRGRNDTCENCIHFDDRRCICRLDKKDVEENDWCKHHKSEDEE